MVFTVGFAFLLVFLIYGVNVLELGWYMLPFVALLLMSGWYVGFLVASLIVRFGTRIQTLAWSGVYLLAPFSAIYYPVETLPAWAQTVAHLLPMSYVFEGMRAVLFSGSLETGLLLKSLGLDLLYLVLAIGFFRKMFEASRKAGLASLE
jgi:ABC-2 type transport system permease protein